MRVFGLGYWSFRVINKELFRSLHRGRDEDSPRPPHNTVLPALLG
jgi:hypothetical protein